MGTTEERFAKYAVKTDSCWLWSGSLRSGGYPILWNGQRQVAAHRWSYEQHVGPIPDGLVIDHLCRVRHCVNPAHLEPVTSRENTRRSELTIASRNAAKTHCPSGHPYDEENTHQGKLGRYCRACLRGRKS